MSSTQSAEDEPRSVDAAEPFRGVVVCCTSIPPEQRADIATKVAELGGIHKYDLTPDATHLVVGDYDTPKYRHVARERQDVKAMDAAWIEAVTELWRNDDDIDFAGLERQHQLKPLEKCGAHPSPPEGEPATRQPLLVCLTGFGEQQREEIAHKIESNGGRYTGDLTRRCTHLIVNKPEGNKFTAAKAWGVCTVTLDWLHQSIARGMILEEAKFDPLLPAEDQGVGAWIKKSLGKRSRSSTRANASDEGQRKLRKTASTKLSSQRNNLWGDILGRSTSRDNSLSQSRPPEEPTQPASYPDASAAAGPEDQGVFCASVFATHGFDRRRQTVLEDTIATLGGSVASSLEAATCGQAAAREPSHRFLVVPQTSQPDAHPHISSDDVHIVTELYIERCLHNKRFFHPNEHILGRPFPLFPIPGFSDLTICSAAFSGLELSQLARSVAQLGAQFEEEFRPTTSLVVCKSLPAMRKEKLRYALEWGVPVVSADWLWECISTGFNVPVAGYIFPELLKQYPARQQTEPGEPQPSRSRQQSRRPPTPTVPRPVASRLPAATGVDATGFDPDSPATKGGKRPGRPVPQEDSTTSADLATATTQRGDTARRASDAPLDELSSASLNKPPPAPGPPKRAVGTARTRSAPTATSGVAKPPAATTPRGPSAPPPDTAAPRRDAAADDSRRKQARAAARRELSSRLSSLLDPTGTGGPGTADGDAPRRRRILGRAVSNASSADGRPAPAPAPGSGGGGDGHGHGDAGEGGDAPPPPATQLEYRDPRVLECKAALASAMAGGRAGPEAEAEAEAEVEADAGAAGVRVGGRTLRKR